MTAKSNSSKSNSSVGAFKFFPQLCSLITAALGMAAIAGWLIGSKILASIRPDYIPMAPNTALSFIVLGISLYALIAERRTAIKLSRAGVVVILILSLIRFIELSANIKLNVDQWIFRVPAERLGFIPTGRMALPTALNFLFASIAILLASSLKKHLLFVDVITRILAGLTTFIGLVFCLGYIYGAPLLYGGTAIPMALNTAVAFFTLGLGLVLNNLSHDIAERKQVREALKKAHAELEIQVAERTSELAGVNEALRADIIERKKAGEELKKAVLRAENEKAKSEAIIAAIGDGITIQDRDYKIIYQNQVAINFIGNHIGEYCYMAYEGKEGTCEGCPVATSFRNGGVHTTVRNVPTDKGMQYFENTSSAVRDPEGNIIAGIEIVRDITERKKVEEELKKSEADYKELTEVLGAALEDVKKRERILLRGRDAFLNMLEDNSDSYKELTTAYESTIEGWSRALDFRDKETEGHSKRVTDIALQIAREIGMSEEELVHVRRGALLHDIGKLGVPDSILFKPGKLNEEEWELMKKHPVIAYELLSPITFLHGAIDIPYCHHEKWDGTGYPQGLKAGEIPLAARIFALVDVWDALRSDRPYRPAWSVERTRDYIASLKGIQFDPELVGIFLKSVE